MSNSSLAGPVTRLTRNGKHRWLRSGWVILVCLVIAVPAGYLAQLPTPPALPKGVVLELPGTADGALAVLRALSDARDPDAKNEKDRDPHDLDRARTAILWDFLFILSYSIGLATLLEWIASRGPERPDALTGYAAWGAIFAGIADIIENISMLTLISTYQHHPDANLGLPALIGTVASLIKWTLVLAVLGYTAWDLAKSIARAFKQKHAGVPLESVRSSVSSPPQ